MNIQIFSSDFDLTESIKSRVEEGLLQACRHLPVPPNFKVYLSKPGRHEYLIKLETHLQGRDVLASAKSDDFYRTLTLANKHLARQFDEMHSKNVSSHTSLR